MPYYPADYHPFFPLRNGHLQTIWSPIFRLPGKPGYKRENVELADGDFIHLDWCVNNSDTLAVLCHGMEGSSDASYMKAMTRQLSRNNYDVVAYNFRGCSGVSNRLLRGYHSGDTADLDAVIQHITVKYKYKSLVLAGFSLGGNMVLKYAGEKGYNLIPDKVAAVSAPCHLASCAEKMNKWDNKLYLNRFLNDFYKKLKEKDSIFPGKLPMKKLKRMKSFRDLDTWYTAPFHGFSGPESYWEKSSSLYWLSEIRKPALLINAQDDPLLSDLSYPVDIACNNPTFHFLHSKYGGHMGFVRLTKNTYWYEEKIIRFLGQSD